MNQKINHYWMRQALSLARYAEQQGEVPIGAVLVKEDVLIGEGWNQPIITCDPTAHAEIVAMRQAAQRSQNYRLPDTTLYITLEPCIMCIGAILHARIERIVCAALSPNSDMSKLKVAGVECVSGVLQEEAEQVLRGFFELKRIEGRGL